jgi:hypothetical protein
MPVNIKRQGNKWTVNELLSLQREYELLELSVQEIAENHKRSETSILYKLEREGLIDGWTYARGFDSEKYQQSISTKDEDNYEVERGGDDDDDYQFVEDAESDEDISDDESDVDKLTERVWSLETSVGEISSMVKNIYSMLSAKQSNKKRKPLRTSTATSSA